MEVEGFCTPLPISRSTGHIVAERELWCYKQTRVKVDHLISNFHPIGLKQGIVPMSKGSFFVQNIPFARIWLLLYKKMEKQEYRVGNFDHFCGLFLVKFSAVRLALN